MPPFTIHSHSPKSVPNKSAESKVDQANRYFETANKLNRDSKLPHYSKPLMHSACAGHQKLSADAKMQTALKPAPKICVPTADELDSFNLDLDHTESQLFASIHYVHNPMLDSAETGIPSAPTQKPENELDNFHLDIDCAESELFQSLNYVHNPMDDLSHPTFAPNFFTNNETLEFPYITSEIEQKEMTFSEASALFKQKLGEINQRFIPFAAFYINTRNTNTQSLNINPSTYVNQFIDAPVNKFIDRNADKTASEKLDVLRKEAKKYSTSLIAKYRNGRTVRSVQQLNTFVMRKFIGGISEGRSYGLRGWVAQQSNASEACDVLEAILSAVVKNKPLSRQMHAFIADIKPDAEVTLARLKKDIPLTYQTRGNKHPPLPFFNRLEMALSRITSPTLGENKVIEID